MALVELPLDYGRVHVHANGHVLELRPDGSFRFDGAGVAGSSNGLDFALGIASAAVGEPSLVDALPNGRSGDRSRRRPGRTARPTRKG